MKNIIFVGYDLTTKPLENESLVSGEIKNANYLMQSLISLGVTVTPISIALSRSADVTYSIDKSKAKGFFRWIYEAREINKIINNIGDMESIIYLTVPSYLPFIKLGGRKVIITAHGTYWPELMADLKYEESIIKKGLHIINGIAQLLIDRLSFKRSNYVHSVSEFQVKEMIETYSVNEREIFSLRNGTNFTNLNLSRDYDLIWVGRIAKKKNLKLFIDFANKIKARRICICAGNDYFAIDKYSKGILNDLKNDSRFEIFSDVKDNALCRLMNRSKYLVVSSTGYESIPTVIFEGVASGCYVLAPDSWGVREVEGNGVLTYTEGLLDSMLSKYNSNEAISGSRTKPSVDDNVRWVNRAKLFKENFNL